MSNKIVIFINKYCHVDPFWDANILLKLLINGSNFPDMNFFKALHRIMSERSLF